ncbi:hypothetical protein L596_028380 [Steinernema carpocapsae]|uniref:Uncharacterized protein n=1 Tax=Steinernema carpocapsae TaxID=34508 RepID=A0A4U5LYA5_STECR|nr:hypothetical protein L596_028380 [Steinernema carpocapsae]
MTGACKTLEALETAFVGVALLWEAFEIIGAILGDILDGVLEAEDARVAWLGDILDGVPFSREAVVLPGVLIMVGVACVALDDILDCVALLGDILDGVPALLGVPTFLMMVGMTCA